MLSFILFWLWSHFSAPVALRIGATRHPIFGADLFILIGGGISNSLVIAKKKMELSCSYRSCLLGHLMKLKPSAINHIQVKMGSSGIFDPLGEVLLNNIHLNGAFRARCCYFGDQKRWRHKTSAAKQRLFDRNWFRLGKSGGAASSSSDWTKKSEGYETASRFGTAFIWLWPIRRAVS